MKSREDKKKKTLNKKRIKRIKRYEHIFSANKYSGRGKNSILKIDGNSAVALSAPFAVNSYVGEEHKAQRYSGALTRLLAYEAGCHAICIKRHQENNYLKSNIKEWIEEKQINVLIDVQILPFDNSNAVLNVCTESTKYEFIKRAIQYSFEFKYKKSGLEKVVDDVEIVVDSITKRAAQEKDIEYVCLLINEKYFNLSEQIQFLQLYDALYDTLTMLTNLDWKAEKIKVYKLWQSDLHKPQDKIEIENSDFAYNSLLNISSYGFGLEKVRNHKVKPDFAAGFIKSKRNIEEYVFLTNRLIGLLTGANWKEESHAGLPVIVYENSKDEYQIGLPMANQVNGIYFSSKLMESKREEALKFDYVVFNRYTDSRINIKYAKADYGDGGRVRQEKVMIPRYYKRLLGYLDYPLKMIRTEEYIGLKERLRDKEKNGFEECYEPIPGEIFYQLKPNYCASNEADIDVTEIVEDLLNPGKNDTSTIKQTIYSLMPGELIRQNKYPVLFDKYSIEDDFNVKRVEKENGSFFILTIKKSLEESIKAQTPDIDERLKKISISVDLIIEKILEISDDSDGEDKRKKETINNIRRNKIYAGFAQGRLGVFDKVEVLRVPKEVKPKVSLCRRFLKSVDRLVILILKKAIGKAEYLLKVEWCSETDDRNNVARLSANIMNLLGISENDKILVKFGKKQEVLRVLINEELTDYQIGIPSSARKKLGMNSVNDIVIVHRDMKHIFLRNSEEQTIAILGTVLAVFQVFTKTWAGLLICLVAIPAIMYFVLNEERVKVK